MRGREAQPLFNDVFDVIVVVVCNLKYRCFRALVKMVNCANARQRGTTFAGLAVISLKRLRKRSPLNF